MSKASWNSESRRSDTPTGPQASVCEKFGHTFFEGECNDCGAPELTDEDMAALDALVNPEDED